ncbi:hypothetical protein K439DRAFT_544533 [Ramaria rubella]|nr:hypothetical protein K439DRAFT_544533 [Ramaria rubella]
MFSTHPELNLRRTNSGSVSATPAAVAPGSRSGCLCLVSFMGILNFIMALILCKNANAYTAWLMDIPSACFS